MKAVLGLGLSIIIAIGIILFGSYENTAAEQPLYLAYPPNNHETIADKIFLIGTASPQSKVTINGHPIERSKAGHFAPSFPLNIGKNQFTLRANGQEMQLIVTRISAVPEIPQGIAFANNSLTPSQNIAQLPNEMVCFSAIAPPKADVSVKTANQTIPLYPQSDISQLPANSAILTDKNAPITTSINKYKGCTKLLTPGQFGHPLFQLTLNNQTIAQKSPGTVEILNPNQLEVIRVTANQGVTRTGPSTDYSRLTPLPKGTFATVIGKEGDWLRLDYGAWIQQNETQSLGISSPPKTLIRSIKFQKLKEVTEIVFPLETPVPLSLKEEPGKLILTLYNTTAQTDTIRLEYNPIIKSFTWQQVNPNQVEYTFHLISNQQWGYDLKYEGSNLIFTLRHSPQLNKQSSQPLEGIKILLDPGHGGQELGSKGPNGYPEKSVNLIMSQLLKQELVKRGATVYMTRETDKDISLKERVDIIDQLKPTIAISIHYNALPDGGDAMKTAGVATFWYHSQAENLSKFLHDYLVDQAQRPSYGVFWNNLALTRPHTTPAILLELGFMINPNEFEWIANSQEQEKLSQTLANGITEWFKQLN